jgi:pantoate--beta-alanine ligase
MTNPLGLIPTMGFLHEGHLSLVRTARANCASVVASIFVNPTQFGPDEDLASYPRNLERDLNLLEQEKVDLVWAPTPEIMYSPDFQTWVQVEKVSQPLEGEVRPGHFRGVATAVAKLFNAVQPQKAYFGQKDAQQTAVIRQMVRDLNFQLEIIICPTIREPDGLAMSSRNSYLNSAERKAANVLFSALTATHESYMSGERNAQTLRQVMTKTIQKEPLAQIQYVSCAQPDSLHEIEGSISGRTLLSMAVFIGKTRLIDNMIIGE